MYTYIIRGPAGKVIFGYSCMFHVYLTIPGGAIRLGPSLVPRPSQFINVIYRNIEVLKALGMRIVGIRIVNSYVFVCV